jgi:hypothetical protein
MERNRLRDAPLWVHGLAWGGFVVVALSWVAFYFACRDANVWLHWLGSDGAQQWPQGTETHFNERIYPNSVFRTPSNTWSNLGYVLVGMYVLSYALYDSRRPKRPWDPYAVRVPGMMVYAGLMSVALGFGSAFMHASLTGIGGWYDIFAMFGSLVARIGASRIPSWPFFIAVALPASYALAEIHGRYLSDIQIMTGLIGTIITGYCLELVLRRHSIQLRWPLLSAGLFALAFAIWNLTNAQRFTNPEVWYQGHAIWHVLTAIALGFLANTYRAEVPLVQRETAPVPVPSFGDASGVPAQPVGE